jgi:hypothetical protein
MEQDGAAVDEEDGSYAEPTGSAVGLGRPVLAFRNWEAYPNLRNGPRRCESHTRSGRLLDIYYNFRDRQPSLMLPEAGAEAYAQDS